jgi:hypothetical protein
VKPDYFWTDFAQATERLNHSVVLYDNEPVYVRELIGPDEFDDGIPRAVVINCATPREPAQRKMLNSPHFRRFRELPKLGWMNTTKSSIGSVFLARRVATTRVHGLTNGNVTMSKFLGTPDGSFTIQNGREFAFTDTVLDKAFAEMHHGRYPTLAGILANIREGTAIAYGRKFCVVRDQIGIRWLYRDTDRVGIFTGADTLNIISKFAYLREEIMADEAFTLNTIREF